MPARGTSRRWVMPPFSGRVLSKQDGVTLQNPKNSLWYGGDRQPPAGDVSAGHRRWIVLRGGPSAALLAAGDQPADAHARARHGWPAVPPGRPVAAAHRGRQGARPALGRDPRRPGRGEAAGTGDLRARPRHRSHLRVPERERLARAAGGRAAAGPRAAHAPGADRGGAAGVVREAPPRRVRRGGRVLLRRRRLRRPRRRHGPYAAAGRAAGAAGSGRAPAGRARAVWRPGDRADRSDWPTWPARRGSRAARSAG